MVVSLYIHYFIIQKVAVNTMSKYVYIYAFIAYQLISPWCRKYVTELAHHKFGC